MSEFSCLILNHYNVLGVINLRPSDIRMFSFLALCYVRNPAAGKRVGQGKMPQAPECLKWLETERCQGGYMKILVQVDICSKNWII